MSDPRTIEPGSPAPSHFGRYRVLRELGRGSMGVVYHAHDPHIDRPVALKVLRHDRVMSQEFVERFLKEARAIGRLSHPHIVNVYDVGEDHGTVFIAMEFIEGRALNACMVGEAFDLERIAELTVQVAEALDYAHGRGIVHRDIKPSNIIVQPDGSVKITDFGIARIEDPAATQHTQAGDILGTPAYMSPEQVLGKQVDGRSDLFSLGVILYELVCGRRPFAGKAIGTVLTAIVQEEPPTPAAVRPDLPESVARVISRCLQKDPEARYRTGRELARAVRAWRAPEAGRSEDIGRKTPVVPVISGRRKAVYAVTLFVLLATGAALVASRTGLLSNPKVRVAVESDPPGAEILIDDVPHGTTSGAVKLRPGKAVLQVVSVPPGADVSVDGELKGVTPFELEVPLGEHRIGLSKAGYADHEEVLAFESERLRTVTVELSPKSAVLEIQSDPPGATVFVEGREQGTTPLVVETPPGRYLVAASKTGHHRWEGTVRVSEQKKAVLRIRLPPVVVYLQVGSSPPGARLFVDGEDAGETPARVPVSLGTHDIRLELAGYRGWTRTIQVPEGFKENSVFDLGTVSLEGR